jgi:spermidine synthase
VTPGSRSGVFFVLMFLSGLAGLGYEMIWVQMFSIGLGHEILSVLAVVAAFFAGLALGAHVFGRIVRSSSHPGRWYAAFELVIGLWAVALVDMIPVANRAASTLLGEQPSWLHHWSIAFAIPLVVLLPATTAMGGTLPAIDTLLARLRQHTHSVAGVYAANTFGAVAGTLLAVFLVAPALGFTVTLYVLAVINGICALIAWFGAGTNPETRAPCVRPVLGKPSKTTLVPILFATGLLGIGYEVVVVRVLSQVLENTVYTYASLLAVYLLGTALGAAAYQRWAPRPSNESLLVWLLVALATCCLAGIVALSFAQDSVELMQAALGPSYVGSLVGEMCIAGAVFALPTLFMGALFSHLAQAARSSIGVGSAMGVNTIGGAIAPALFGVMLFPLVGSRALLVGIAVAYLFFIPRGSGRNLPIAAVALLGGALLLAPLSLTFISIPPGGDLITHREGIMATVAVASDAAGGRRLKVNDRFSMGGTSGTYSDFRQAHIPLLLHPAPRDALFLGLGAGVTFAGATTYSRLKADGVELVPEVVAVLPYFESATGKILEDDSLRLITADARRFVRVTEKTYDVVIADLFHPSRDGAGSLYTSEHFEAIKRILRDDGLFCQWLPLHQLDLPTVRMIARTFLHVFPNSRLYLAHYSLDTPLLGLIGEKSEQRTQYSLGWIKQRSASAGLKHALAKIGLRREVELFEHQLADSTELRRFAEAGPLNTDDHPRVTFEAPRFVYGSHGDAASRLSRLLKAVNENRLPPSPERYPESRLRQRIAAHWAGRDDHLKSKIAARLADTDQTLRN